MIAQLREKWQQTSFRERRLLMIAIIVIAAAAVFLAGKWLYKQYYLTQASVPVAQRQLAQMQLDAEELNGLKNLAPPTNTDIQFKLLAARAAASAAKLPLQIDLQGDGLHVSGNANTSALLDWAGAMQKDQLLRIIDAKVTPSGDQLTVDLRLEGATQ